jgi:hypothetical protein
LLQGAIRAVLRAPHGADIQTKQYMTYIYGTLRPDAQVFGTKFLNPVDLERLRDGLRKAGLYPDNAGLPATTR